MNAVLDAGNSRIKVGIYEGEKLLRSEAFAGNPIHELYTHLAGQDFDQVLISSVIELPAHILSYLQAKAKAFFLLDSHIKLPFKITYKIPSTLGPDRIALAAGAAKRYPGQNVLAIGLGSCITYNFLEKGRSYAGGAISPGLQMRLKAMHTFTHKLPLVEVHDAEEIPITGQSTDESLLSGAVNGMAFELAGFAEAYRAKFGDVNIILAGGDATYFGERFPAWEIAPDLVLEGLNTILNFNAKAS